MQIRQKIARYGFRIFIVALISLLTVNLSHLSGKDMNHSRRVVDNRTIHLDSYKDSLWLLWNKVYVGKAASLYCGQSFDTQKEGKVSEQGINAEHVFPMSWAANALKCGTRKQCQRTSKTFRHIEADLHNIYPAMIKLNSARMSFPFGEIGGEKRQFGKHCDFEVDRKRRIAEPRHAVRGDIARAMLYMAYQYDLPLFDKTRKRLKKWDKQDAPSKEERRRAKIIQSLQGRENPYIARYPFNGDAKK